MSGYASSAAVERGQVYDLLATVFRRPLDASQLQRLRAPEMLAAMAAAGIDLGRNFSDDPIATVLDQLAIDYTQLFHGPGKRIAPYEGILLEGDDNLMGRAAGEVRRFMAAVGYALAPESGELPDHISVELAFLSELARREAQALSAGDKKAAGFAASRQRAFLSEHLARWVGEFSDQVRDKAELPFYAEMAGFLSGFVSDERADKAA